MWSIPLALLTVAANSTAVPNPGTFAILGGVIAAVRRKSPIGGWLFYFIWQVVVGAGLGVLQIAVAWRSYIPAAWADPARYLIYILSIAPRLAALLTVAFAFLLLVRTLDWRWVALVRGALIAHLLCGLAAITIDHLAFPEDLTFSYSSMIFPTVLLIYTYKSERFRRVFQSHDWRPA